MIKTPMIKTPSSTKSLDRKSSENSLSTRTAARATSGSHTSSIPMESRRWVEPDCWSGERGRVGRRRSETPREDWGESDLPAEEWGERESAHSDSAHTDSGVGDAVRMMLRDFGRVPLLTVDQEQALAIRIQLAKTLYRRRLLGVRRVAEAGVALLRAVLAGSTRLDRALEVSLADTEGKDRLLQVTSVNLVTLEGLLAGWSDSASLPRRLRAKVAKLIDETSLHTGRLEEAYQRTAVSDSQVERAKARYDRLRNQMVVANMRLAVSIAKNYRKSGVPFVDLVQEGSEGLMRAAEKFDPARGFKFSTYAVWWIRQRISSAAAEKSRLIRMNEGTLRKLRELTQQAVAQYQQDPQSITFEQIRPSGMTASREADLRRSYFAAREMVSLDQPLGTDDALTTSRLVTMEHVDQEERLVQAEEEQQVEKALQGLTEREQTVLHLRFGLGKHREHSLAETGSLLNLSRERIRQLERNGLRKLRSQLAPDAD